MRLLHPLLLALSFSLETTAQRCWRQLTCTGPSAPSFPGPWDVQNFAPASRTLQPKRILSLPAGALLSQYPGPAPLSRNGSALVFDFGLLVGGLITLTYTSTGPGRIGLAFSEARDYIGEWSDASNGRFRGPDGAVYGTVNGGGRGRYVMPDWALRGGFRYLTVFWTTGAGARLEVQDVELEIAFQPTWADLRAYQGYFHCSDRMLNRIWYAGAYTLQTNAVPTNTGRMVPMLNRGWANNATLGPGDSIIVDGAKRDRAVWPGDMGVAVPASFVSTGDLESVRNALQVMFDYQNKDGSFPEAGPPLLQQNSDTYHMWTLIGTYNYMLYTDDTAFLDKNWAKFQRAVAYIADKVEDGLLHVSGTRDWARWGQGGPNAEANMILYHTLTTAALVATWTSRAPPSLAQSYTVQASALRTAINAQLYDPPFNSFKDNTTRTALHPQDANALAILFNITSGPRSAGISTSLTKNWTPIGPSPPELPGNISPFITSFELAAHFSINQTARALDLLRRTWGWYIDHPNGTQSTLIEGYRTDGSWGYRRERGYKDESYVSHAHGWSAGPTSALTHYIAGLDVIERLGRRWSVRPQFGDLRFAEAGFVTRLGKFRTGWRKVEGGYDVEIETPVGTEGDVVLPVLSAGVMPTVMVNGAAARARLAAGVEMVLPGGRYNITVR
ncbi:Six-hairpin glycosidase [Trichodelitschia bisporula]|uniref:Six-hairpin glycosidase n=1 Tax=Trichodelitschia bisporula TaxID=703511 RepID=A0A6G1HSA4_9PEZI|nr:Six-hairpin glycosidase [Trichodelitschia bisporula]